ncbi:MAG TPA: ABC transporter substrate-binding protein [Ruminococcaceae bacterium]|nr:ABC transporter substrate-binding protein [Oscillospiraceae bacterium]
MKKILSAILAAAVICTSMLVLAGCGNSKQESKASDASATESSASKGELHMATNAEFPPYEYIENKKVVGIDADIAQAICDKLGYTLVIDNMKFDAIIAAVTSGKADFGMAGMTVTEERKQAVDFTDTYAKTTQVIIVKDGSDKVKNADDLEKAAIGVQLGTTGDIFVSDFKDAKIQRYSKGSEAVEALSTGKVDAVVIDSEPAKEFVKAKTGLKILSDPFAEEQYAICLKKGNKLTEEINKALDELKKDGTLDKIVKKYIGE